MIKYLKQEIKPYKGTFVYAIVYGEQEKHEHDGTVYVGILFDPTGLVIPVNIQESFYTEITENEFWLAVPPQLVISNLKLKRDIKLTILN